MNNHKVIQWSFIALMKMTCLQLTILVTGVLLAKASDTPGQEMLDRKVLVEAKGESIKSVLTKIEKQTAVTFSYKAQLLRSTQAVTLAPDSLTIKEALDLMFNNSVRYEAIKNQIFLELVNNMAIAGVSEALSINISGVITDGENGGSLPGVNVIVKGTGTGTTTDNVGRYAIEVPDQNSVLVFSFIGYEAQEVVVGVQTQINPRLVPDVRSLDEVVVTAFGIEKEKRQLVYSTQEVDGKDLTAVGNANLLNGLQGKIAGVSVNLNSGMPGKSPDVRIRGYRSLTGSNAPLYVIDGMPVAGGGRQVDFNPNDIESINVLKGQAASALYGLRAANGVILITTKNGRSSKNNPTITFDSHYNIDEVAFLAETQKEFAQGLNGAFDPNSIWTWGPRISELGTYTNQMGEQEEAAVYDNQKDFYQKGGTVNSNITFANGSDIGNFLIGLGHSHQKGVVPNTDMTRINLKVNGELNLTKRFKIQTSFNYSDLNVSDFPETFGNDNFFRGLIETPPSYNLAGKPYARPDNPYSQIFYRASQNNPYWVINNNFRDEQTKRTFGNIFLKYDLMENLSLNYRLGIDHYSLNRMVHRELGDGPGGRANPPRGGQLVLSNAFSSQVNSNMFLAYDKKLGENFSIDVILGNEIFDNSSKSNTSTGSNYLVGGWPNLSNTTLLTASNSESRNRIVGFYGNMNLGWKNMFFLNASARNDVVSNMLAGNRSFLYPSVGTSVILTEAVPGLKDVFSFAKIRATYAEVGQAGPLYVNDRGFSSFSPSGFTFPYLNLGSWTQNTTRVSPSLEPENTKSIELGFDFRFFKDRVGIDYTYYRNRSEGQIFSVPIPVTTGATSEIRNAGELLSYGHEIMLSLTVIESSAWNWQLNTNFSTYKNRVESLYGDTDRVVITAGDGISLVAETGETYPAFLGRSFLRDPASGQIVVQSNAALVNAHGLPLIESNPAILGTPNPDFEFNFINSVRYKTFNLSFQLDWRKGGQIFSQSLTESLRRGLAPETLERENDVILEGKKGTIVNGALTVEGDNDIVIKKDFRYGNIMHQITENILMDASFVRLREVSLSYDLPANLLGDGFIKSASLFITGRNIFLITDSFVDPELNTSEGFAQSSNSAGIEWSQIPQTRSYGAGFRLRF